MGLPREQLLSALCQRMEAKRQTLKELDDRYGKDRVWICSYLENIALPDLFGYDMNDLYSDPALGLEMELRHRIFWLDNSEDDCLPGLNVCATVGMYFDLTLFGQEVRHTRQGVPEFTPHPISREPELSLLPNAIDFHTSGIMPQMLAYCEQMQKLAGQWYGDEIKVNIGSLHRGPLDLYIQLRGYENFVDDTMDRPEFVREMMAYLVRQRARWNSERQKFLGAAPGEIQIHDDWVNIPFITPAMFREFALPAYLLLQELEGKVTFFHTCGVMTPVVGDLLATFPGINCLNISGWNDPEELDRLVPHEIGFDLNFINTFTLSGNQAEHRDKLERIATIRRHRRVMLGAQAIVKLHDTMDEDISRMNNFIRLAREIMSA